MNILENIEAIDGRDAADCIGAIYSLDGIYSFDVIYGDCIYKRDECPCEEKIN